MDIKQLQEQYSSFKSQRDSIADEVENLNDNEHTQRSIRISASK